MKKIIHRAADRGHAHHGWLESYHSFSFANYYDPNKMHFGVLRVLNDDRVAAGMGFGTHPHSNMEIISIPLEGELEHKDSMGNTSVIKKGDIQVMSAGTGVSHSEYNKSSESEVRFLQIWIIPNKHNVTPRYDQVKIDSSQLKNHLLQILSPDPDDEGVWIHQNAWFFMSEISEGESVSHHLKKGGNGLYLFVLEGKVEAAGETLEKRDAIGVTDIQDLEIKGIENSSILLMDIPMQL